MSQGRQAGKRRICYRALLVVRIRPFLGALVSSYRMAVAQAVAHPTYRRRLKAEERGVVSPAERLEDARRQGAEAQLGRRPDDEAGWTQPERGHVERCLRSMLPTGSLDGFFSVCFSYLCYRREF